MMKWLILSGFLVCLARFGAGGALKCTPGVDDPLCRIDKAVSDSSEKQSNEPESVTQNADDTSNPNKTSLVEGKECAPDTHWKSKCNDCACSPEGHPHCTEKACPGYEFETEKECAPESRWKKECNTCWCTPDGLALCTKIGCVGIPASQHFKDESTEVTPIVAQNILEEDQHTMLKRSVCKPNQTFQSECNTCKCSSNGQTFSCSENECMDTGVDKDVEVFMDNEGVDHIESHSLCKPRTIFYIACNTCNCNVDGTNYSCTNKFCPLPDDVELFHELKAKRSSINKTKEVVCVANRMFIRDCNTCWCNEDGTSYFCTRKVCVSEMPDETENDEEKSKELRTIKRECRPDEVFEMDCNMCRCNPDGKSFSCTRKACLEQIEEDIKKVSLSRKTRGVPQANTPSTPKACEPGKVFRMDCNQCLCDNEGQDFSCTRIDCIALNNINNGGARTKRDNEFDATADSNFRCNPGEQYKRGCKDCTCSADGKSIFCSVRLCDKDLAHVID